MGITKTFKYAGFISYAHHDERIAARLHKGLETFRMPKGMADNNALSPIFRDASDLTAHHSLPEKINEALETSRFLIVLCSPAAKASFWVNEEIRQFRTLHGKQRILCALLNGTPETSFPLALTDNGDEPLAANLDGGRDVFRLGQTQLAASMLGVGLDRLIQRETQRRRNRFRLLSGASLAFAAVMGAMAWTAMDARNAAEASRIEAETSRDAAEVSRSEAEKMVEFMLTNLKSDLEDLGRLDILDDVGKNVTQYYDAIPLPDMDDDRLAREARARHLLGQVAVDTGNMEVAKTEIQAAYDATQEVMRRNPEATDAIFAHAQSEYWQGAILNNEEDYQGTLIFWKAYALLGQQLYNIDRKNRIFLMERAYGVNCVANVHMRMGDYNAAKTNYQLAEAFFLEALKAFPGDINIEQEVANVLGGLARIAMMQKDVELSKSYRLRQVAIYNAQLIQEPNNKTVEYKRVQVEARMITDGMLDFDSKVYLDAFKSTVLTYNALIEYEPNNERWRRNYLNYLKVEHARWRKLKSPIIPKSIQKDIEETIKRLK